MTDVQKITAATAVIAVLITGLNGWLIYLGAKRAAAATERASEESAETQRQANGAQGLAMLSQEQRAELTRTYQRAAAAEQHAAMAEEAAETARRTAERCQMRMTVLVGAYRELHGWASQPCPHQHPPPDVPKGLNVLGD